MEEADGWQQCWTILNHFNDKFVVVVFCIFGSKREGGLRNTVGLGLKPVYYTDGGETLKAAGRHHFGNFFQSIGQHLTLLN